ncbi:helix-turn-helix domain-containing protein [Geobacter argillaceus]|uniref:IclR-like helix-turn-helix domain-containing protein n=1 Tax=Geobacter argillaceus TaxID=345631 RepID=A0A562WS59_9BACT|nr:helix-turn-helix domain-containing protein [Geobacter argillaceus]TWJ33101.1 IclR-like helix-turn-helix domain-containing protein [Geobacter argillaceus]
MIKEKHMQTVQTTEKALMLMDILAEGNSSMSIGDLAFSLRCTRSEALLLLIALESRGLVSWDERKKIYRLGDESRRLAVKFLDTADKPNKRVPTPLTLKKGTQLATAVQ